MLSITIKGDDAGVRNYEPIIYLGWHLEGGQIWNPVLLARAQFDFQLGGSGQSRFF